MDWLKMVHGKKLKPEIAFGAGDDVRVWFKILDQGKERSAHFEGVVVRVRGSGASKTFTVRRLTHGEGVERVFPFGSKILERVEVLRRGKVHRARIYFLRNVAKRVRLQTVAERPVQAPAAPVVPPVSAERAGDAAASSEAPAPVKTGES